MRFANELYEKEIKHSIGEDSKANFIVNLGNLLSQTKEGVVSCTRVAERNGVTGDFVVISFKNNTEKVVSIYNYDYIAIMQAVLNVI